jgi:hypothetical protein
VASVAVILSANIMALLYKTDQTWQKKVPVSGIKPILENE